MSYQRNDYTCPDPPQFLHCSITRTWPLPLHLGQLIVRSLPRPSLPEPRQSEQRSFQLMLPLPLQCRQVLTATLWLSHRSYSGGLYHPPRKVGYGGDKACLLKKVIHQRPIL